VAGSSALQRLLARDEAERRLGPFALVRQLGSGGFAPVWLAREVYGGTEVRAAAVKLFGLDELGTRRVQARILEEARALCRVEHPNVVRFYALSIDEDAGVMGLAMEHVAGTALDERLRRDARLSPPETVALGLALASALGAVHRAGLVHRDVKPANVIDVGGDFKLIDFGIAAPGAGGLEPAGPLAEVALVDASGATPTGGSGPGSLPWFGTPGYVDPECVRGGLPPDPSSDLYALGATLFQCLAGSVPAAIGARRGMALRLDVLDGRAPAPPLAEIAPEVPPALARLVDLLLAPRRADRPPSTERVSALLEQARAEIAGTRGSLPPESVGPFRGLGRYDARDRHVFFGRSTEIAAVLEALRASGLVALVGPSGSGKSSLARAGVLPAVEDGALSRWPTRWDTVAVEPGRDPRDALGAALAPFVPGAPSLEVDELVGALAARVDTTDRGLLILFDQLEEIATMAHGAGRAFVEALLARLSERPMPGVRVLVTVRRDLLDALLAIGPLGKAILRGAVLVEPMTDLAWGGVLDQALAAYGYAFADDALRADLVAEIRGAASAMPLVQFALTEIWTMRDVARKQLTREGLSAIGGLAGALDRHAERTLAELTRQNAGAAARTRDVLLALTTPEGTRASLPLEDVPVVAGTLGPVILSALERARLVVHGQGGVTLAHETLITQWARLRRWVAEAREDRLLADELERDAALWATKRDRVALWQRGALRLGEALRDRADVRISDAGKRFLAASRRAEGRRRLAVMSTVAAFVGAFGGGTWAYVHAIEAEEAGNTLAAAADQRSRELLAERSRSVGAAQARIDRLLLELESGSAPPPPRALASELRELRTALGDDGPPAAPDAGTDAGARR
jgi:serine/threonine protein kinase/energy-coupling factor transporter ATP-binding protein EcfA2